MLKVVKGSEKIKAEIESLRKGFYFLPEENAVKKIISQVLKGKDRALFKLTKKYDKADLSACGLQVKEEEIKAAYKKVDKATLSALNCAIENIRSFHDKQKPDIFFDTAKNDVVLGLRAVPIDRVGVYVPGGSAVYPSSVLMNVIPALVAGVGKVCLCSPPNKNKTLHPLILVAADQLGVREIYKVGGAQAIAAMAFGTESIPKVDKIAGPGNVFVNIAKLLLSKVVGIDKFAGPSDVLILADCESNPAFAAADLLAQAEHDANASVFAVSNSLDFINALQKEIVKQLKGLKRRNIIQQSLKKRGRIFFVSTVDEMVAIANLVAPEHLEIMLDNPQSILEKIKHAGAVFMGPYSPVTVGDYMAGPNHVLPTEGGARFSSPLGVYDFIKYQSFLGYTKSALKENRLAIEKLANIEGLDAHAHSISIRFK